MKTLWYAVREGRETASRLILADGVRTTGRQLELYGGHSSVAGLETKRKDGGDGLDAVVHTWLLTEAMAEEGRSGHGD